MPEVLLPFPRAFVEFVDPADPDTVLRCDLTWLTSRWTCIFGRGCPGVYADRPDDGCCTLGAHFADAADEARVRRAVRRLTDEHWQHRSAARRVGWVGDDSPEAATPGEPPDRVTTLVDGACVFLNRPGFAGGAGCALHHLAAAEGRSVVDTKPDVCWQLPIRREFRTVTRPDDTTYTEVSLGEYGREGWGPGGHDFDWYCTANTDAHVADRPVYLSCAEELVALVGRPAYEMLARLCAEAEDGLGPSLRHPAKPV